MEKELNPAKNSQNKENSNMDNNSLNATEIAVGSLLAGNRGGGGMNGGGAWGGGYGGHGVFAGPTSNAIRINESAKASAVGLENLLDQNQFAVTNKSIIDGFNREADTSTNNVNRVADNQFRSELRSSDQINSLEREIAQNARFTDKNFCEVEKSIASAAKDAAKCCCDAKLEACKNTSEILASAQRDKTEILTAISAIKDRELNAANAKITQLETINALADRGHRG